MHDLMTLPREQLEREKTRAEIIAMLEVVLGGTMLFIGFQLFNLYGSLQYSMFQMMRSTTTPKETIDMLNLILSVTIAAGFFTVFHGIKRMADNVLNAWVKSAIPKNES